MIEQVNRDDLVRLLLVQNGGELTLATAQQYVALGLTAYMRMEYYKAMHALVRAALIGAFVEDVGFDRLWLGQDETDVVPPEKVALAIAIHLEEMLVLGEPRSVKSAIIAEWIGVHYGVRPLSIVALLIQEVGYTRYCEAQAALGKQDEQSH